jgi:hypothetical protein
MAVAGEQPDADGVASGHQPVTVVLDLVDPARTYGRSLGSGRQARLNEAGGTYQHARS